MGHDLKICGLPISLRSRQHCWQILNWKIVFYSTWILSSYTFSTAGLKLCQTVVVTALVGRFFAIVVIHRHCFLCYTCLAQDEWEHFQYVLQATALVAVSLLLKCLQWWVPQIPHNIKVFVADPLLEITRKVAGASVLLWFKYFDMLQAPQADVRQTCSHISRSHSCTSMCSVQAASEMAEHRAAWWILLLHTSPIWMGARVCACHYCMSRVFVCSCFCILIG